MTISPVLCGLLCPSKMISCRKRAGRLNSYRPNLIYDFMNPMGGYVNIRVPQTPKISTFHYQIITSNRIVSTNHFLDF